MRFIFPTMYQPVCHGQPRKHHYTGYVLAQSLDEAQGFLRERHWNEVPCQGVDPRSRKNRQIAMTRLDRQYDRLLGYCFPRSDRPHNRRVYAGMVKGYQRRVRQLQHSILHCLNLLEQKGQSPAPIDLYSDLGVLHVLHHAYDPEFRTELKHTPEIRDALTWLTNALPEMFFMDSERAEIHDALYTTPFKD